MKKFFIPIYILISFFFIDNINAQTIEVNYSSNYVKTNYLTSEKIQQAEEVKAILEDSYWSNYDYNIFINKSTVGNVSYNYITYQLFPKVNNKFFTLQVFNRRGYSSGLFNRKVSNLVSDGLYSSYDSSIPISSLCSNTGRDTSASTLITYMNNGTYPSSTNCNEKVPIASWSYTTSDIDIFQATTQNDLLYYSSIDYQIGGLVTSVSDIQYMIEHFTFINTDTDFNEEVTWGGHFYSYYESVNNVVIPPNSISSFGNNSYGIKSNNINIINSLGNNINCIKDRNFDSNGFCNFTYNDFDTENIDSILNSDFDIDFSFNDNTSQFPLKDNKYYIFTFRSAYEYNIIPTIVMGYSGDTSIPIQIDDIIITNNGLYKDYQLILHTNNPDSNYHLDSIKLFNISINNFTNNIESFDFSIFNSYKYTQYDNYPTSQEISNNLNTNSLNTINTDSFDNFFGSFSVNSHGLSSFITSPIRLFEAMRETTCSSLTLPLPHLGNITLPCFSSVLESNVPDLLHLYQLIISGIICYYIGLNYFRIIKNAFTPDNDRIEVQDL